LPYVLLVVFAFALAMIFNRGASRGTYLLLAAGAAGATWYFLR